MSFIAVEDECVCGMPIYFEHAIKVATAGSE